MNTLIHADIFFFVTTIIVIIIAIILIIILWNIARIVNDARHVSRKIREGSDVLSQDLNELRDELKTKGGIIRQFLKYFKHLFVRSQNHKK